MARRNIRNIVILLFVLTISTPAFATENWMSTTFQYEHVFNTGLRTDGGSDSLGFDLAWHSFMDNSYAGMFVRTGFLFSVDQTSASDGMVFRTNVMTGPAFKVEIDPVLVWYGGIGPFFSQAFDFSGSGTETALGLSIDTGVRFSLTSNTRTGLFLIAGVTASCNFLNILNEDVVNKVSGQVIPYVGFCLSYDANPYGGYYVYNPLLW